MTPAIALWTSIGAGGVAQIALRLAVGGRGPGSGCGVKWWSGLLLSGWFWLYAACFGVATVSWLLALSGLHISYAFPLVSLNYPLVALLARIFLGESVSPRRWLSIAVICCGVALILLG